MLRCRNRDGATAASLSRTLQRACTMSRKSLGEGSAHVSSAVEVIRSGSTGGFEPSDEQRRMRARLWTELRNDPLIVPAAIGPSRIEAITGEHRVQTWWADKQFRSWVLNRDAALERAEYLVDLWLDIMAARLPMMADKDIVNAGKLLLEVARKMPDRSPKQDNVPAEFSKKSPDELRTYIQQAAEACGMKVVDAPALPPSDP